MSNTVLTSLFFFWVMDKIKKITKALWINDGHETPWEDISAREKAFLYWNACLKLGKPKKLCKELFRAFKVLNEKIPRAIGTGD